MTDARFQQIDSVAGCRDRTRFHEHMFGYRDIRCFRKIVIISVQIHRHDRHCKPRRGPAKPGEHLHGGASRTPRFPQDRARREQAVFPSVQTHPFCNDCGGVGTKHREEERGVRSDIGTWVVRNYDEACHRDAAAANQQEHNADVIPL